MKKRKRKINKERMGKEGKEKVRKILWKVTYKGKQLIVTNRPNKKERKKKQQ